MINLLVLAKAARLDTPWLACEIVGANLELFQGLSKAAANGHTITSQQVAPAT